MRISAAVLSLVLALLAPARAAAAASGEVVVFAAASLREAFTAIAERFEQRHPGTRVVLNLAGSQDLAAQIDHGAVADVFASADAVTMDKLAAAELVGPVRVFARNAAVLVVARDAAGDVRRLEDLPEASRIVLGVPEVPIGRYARQILDRAGARYGADFRRRVERRVVSNELNVRQALAKVKLGEADAAIVYRTDAVTAADRVSIVAIPDDINVVADYPIAVLTGAPHRPLAEQWLSAVLAADGQRSLADLGFLPPAGVAHR